MRDIYDIYYFAKNNWEISADLINNLFNKTVQEYLSDCLKFIEKIPNNRILQGLGELVNNEKEKSWIKNHLKNETIFMLRNYISILN